MNSSCLEDRCCVKFTSETPHFFKIILDDTDRCEKLRMPNKFATKYGSEISSQVSLKVPNGALWKVQLIKRADGTWLHNGWSEFAKHYSLSYGSFLVFRYEGNDNFHVIILDKTATEISYPYSGIHGSSNDDDISVEILDDIPSSVPSRQPHKSTKTINLTSTVSVRQSALKSNAAIKYEVPEPKFNDGNSSFKLLTEICRRKQGKSRTSSRLSQKRSGADVPLSIQQTRAAASVHHGFTSFRSENPYFLITTTRTSFQKVKVPYDFISKHIKQDVVNLTLENPNKLWPVKILAYPKYKTAQLSAGWGRFVSENPVNAGEVCAFELINKEDGVLRVYFFRKSAE